MTARSARSVTAILVSVALVAIAVIGRHGEARIDAVLDDNWRGSYDILVTAEGQDLGGSETEGLVDANFVGTAGSSGISVRDVERIRALEDVEIAAPIGLVGVLRDLAMAPYLEVADRPEAGVSDLPGPLAARAEVVLDDVRTQQPVRVAGHSGHMAMRPRSAEELEPTAFLARQPEEFAAFTDANGMTAAENEGAMMIALGTLPEFASSVVAVDPASEIELEAYRADFLEPLRQAPEERQLGVDADSDEQWQDLVNAERFVVASVELFSAEAQDGDVHAVPLVVAAAPEGSLELRLRVTAAPLDSDDLPTEPRDVQASLDGLEPELWVEDVLDASDLITPFASGGLRFCIEGSSCHAQSPGAFYEPASALLPELSGRPGYAADDFPGYPAFRVEPQGPVAVDGTPPAAGQAALRVQSYRSSTQVEEGTGFHREQLIPAPLGTFSWAEVADAGSDAVSYVPSGISTTPTYRLDGPDAGSEVLPNFSSLDFITTPPGAFTDLAGGELMRGSAPIDAIRVRVADLDGYTSGAQQKVAQVAAQIETLGLQTTIVAGSSPQEVAIRVPDYHLHPDGEREDLGWVSQEWTTLGAAIVVEEAMTGAVLTLSAATLTVLAMALVVSAISAGRSRATETAILTRVGWRRRSIAARFAGQDVPAVVLVIATALVCSLIARPELRTALGAVVALTMATAVLAVVPGFRAPVLAGLFARGGPRRRRELSALGGLAWRRALSAALPMTIAGVGGIAVVAGLGGAAVAEMADSAGATRLAGHLLDALMLSALALIAAGLGAAGLVVALARRVELRARQRAERTLRRAGISPGLRLRTILQEEAIVASCLAVVGIAIGYALHQHTGAPAAPWAAGAAVGLLIVSRLATARSIAGKGLA